MNSCAWNEVTALFGVSGLCKDSCRGGDFTVWFMATWAVKTFKTQNMFLYSSSSSWKKKVVPFPYEYTVISNSYFFLVISHHCFIFFVAVLQSDVQSMMCWAKRQRRKRRSAQMQGRAAESLNEPKLVAKGKPMSCLDLPRSASHITKIGQFRAKKRLRCVLFKGSSSLLIGSPSSC